MNEVLTVLEAEVEESKWDLLKETYKKEAKNVPPSIKQTLLIQSQKEPLKWRIVTHWRSQQDLDDMKRTEEIPVGVRIFKTAQATPSLDTWNTKIHYLGTEL